MKICYILSMLAAIVSFFINGKDAFWIRVSLIGISFLLVIIAKIQFGGLQKQVKPAQSTKAIRRFMLISGVIALVLIIAAYMD